MRPSHRAVLWVARGRCCKTHGSSLRNSSRQQPPCVVSAVLFCGKHEQRPTSTPLLQKGALLNYVVFILRRNLEEPKLHFQLGVCSCPSLLNACSALSLLLQTFLLCKHNNLMCLRISFPLSLHQFHSDLAS